MHGSVANTLARKPEREQMRGKANDEDEALESNKTSTEDQSTTLKNSEVFSQQVEDGWSEKKEKEEEEEVEEEVSDESFRFLLLLLMENEDEDEEEASKDSCAGQSTTILTLLLNSSKAQSSQSRSLKDMNRKRAGSLSNQAEMSW
jgi:hypothetical protein